MKNWKKIGCVRIVYADRTFKEFDSLAKAIDYERYNVRNLKYGRVESRPFEMNSRVSYFSLKDPFEFRDEYNFLIPLWKIFEIENSLPKRVYRFSRDKQFKFRNGPVEGIRHYGGRGYCRHMRTAAERRENYFFNHYDADALDQRIKKARFSELPTLYDDIPYSNSSRNWKKYRSTQWK